MLLSFCSGLRKTSTQCPLPSRPSDTVTILLPSTVILRSLIRRTLWYSAYMFTNQKVEAADPVARLVAWTLPVVHILHWKQAIVSAGTICRHQGCREEAE